MQKEEFSAQLDHKKESLLFLHLNLKPNALIIPGLFSIYASPKHVVLVLNILGGLTDRWRTFYFPDCPFFGDDAGSRAVEVSSSFPVDFFF